MLDPPHARSPRCQQIPQIAPGRYDARGGGHRVMRKLALTLLMAPGLLQAASLQGHVALVVDGKPLRAEEAAEVVVYFRPTTPTPVRPPATPYDMSTQRKQFVPRILPVVVGSQVRFPNQDPILHNAFSTSKDNAFDVGLYGSGEEQTVTFTHAGYVRVYCNVHHSMVGHILVLDTPYFTHPGADGRFEFADLPKGSGDLVIWHDRATPWHSQAVPGETPAVDVTLDLNLRRIPPHTNKFGKPYGRSGNADY
jgi:plastocyanin